MQTISEIFENYGPLTGKELLQKTNLDEFTLWVACNNMVNIKTIIIGRRYLRLDSQVEEYARLSPSILREFYSYTVIGSTYNSFLITQKAGSLKKEIEKISKEKFELAKKIICKIVNRHKEASNIKENTCFMIAGDVVYNMAHAEPRPESSTGELVRGSDLDVVVVAKNLSKDIWNSLDSSIYQEKHKLLRKPFHKEEIDYLVKDFTNIKNQIQSNDFKSMVATKILYESEFLFGNREIFDAIKQMLIENGIPKWINNLEEKAIKNRKKAELHLLSKQTSPAKEFWKLFYTTQENEEIF